MTPQERQRVAELFERLAQLENSPREREAEELIMEGLRYAPNSPYAMVQTILIQEEALERANGRIQELELRAESAPAETSAGGFLDSLRGAFGGNAGTPQRVSVPSAGRRPMGVPPGFRANAAAGNQPQQEIGRGGGFVGQAASIAAGVVVGSMVADALRGQFGSDTTAARQEQAAAGQEARTEDASLEDDRSLQDDGDFETADFDGGFDLDGGDFG